MSPDEDIHRRFSDLLFGVRRSVRYHSRRVRFFDWLHQMATLATLLFGSTTVAVFGGVIAADWPLWAKLLPAFIASVLAAFELAFGVVRKAREHENLMRNFVALEQRMETSRDQLTTELLAQMTERRLEIEANEPPVLRVLDTLCHNELLEAMGYDQQDHIKVSFFQRRFANWFDLGQHTLHSRP